MMKASHEIREAMTQVARLRQTASDDTGLNQALKAVKHLQAQRFEGTYQDLLSHPVYAPSAHFFWKSFTVPKTTANAMHSLYVLRMPLSALFQHPYWPPYWP